MKIRGEEGRIQVRNKPFLECVGPVKYGRLVALFSAKEGSVELQCAIIRVWNPFSDSSWSKMMNEVHLIESETFLTIEISNIKKRIEVVGDSIETTAIFTCENRFWTHGLDWESSVRFANKWEDKTNQRGEEWLAKRRNKKKRTGNVLYLMLQYYRGKTRWSRVY
jgi:hypothetical protein